MQNEHDKWSCNFHGCVVLKCSLPRWVDDAESTKTNRQCHQVPFPIVKSISACEGRQESLTDNIFQWFEKVCDVWNGPGQVCPPAGQTMC